MENGEGNHHWGRASACAIESFTSFPEAHYDLVGRVPVQPGQVLQTSFHAFAYEGKVKGVLGKV